MTNTNERSWWALTVPAEQFATEVLDVVWLKRAASVRAEVRGELAAERVPAGLVCAAERVAPEDDACIALCLRVIHRQEHWRRERAHVHTAHTDRLHQRHRQQIPAHLRTRTTIARIRAEF